MSIGIIKSIENLADDLRIFKIKPDKHFDFIPGQFITIGLKNNEDTIYRAYSIASAPNNELLEFAITLKKDGVLTPKLFDLKIGDSVLLGEKCVGLFNPIKNVTKNKIFISTGTGIAPFISAIKSMQKIDTKICLINGCRYVNNLAYKDDLIEISNNNPNFKYFPITSREKINEIQGHIDVIYQNDSFIKFTQNMNYTNTEIFICGALSMVQNQIEYWSKFGYSEFSPINQTGNIFVEKY